MFANTMASYGDAMVATAVLLSAMNLPQVTQGYWTEHSERAVIPTGLSVLETPPVDKDILGRWKLEGSDTYARSYGDEWLGYRRPSQQRLEAETTIL